MDKKYIYIMSNKDWHYEQKFKYGYTENIYGRIRNSHEQHSYLSMYHSIYEIENTSSYHMKIQEYDKIISILSKKCKQINILQKYYGYSFENLLKIQDFLVNNGGSIEFIYGSGLEIFEKILLEDFSILGLKVIKLSNEDVNEINNTSLKTAYDEYLNDDENIFNDDLLISYVPRDYQKKIIDKSIIYFQEHNKGILLLMCGLGKTLISLWIAQKINSNSILIGVPNKPLLKQWENLINILFKDIPYLIVSDGINIENISLFLENNPIKCIIITTYSSTHKVYKAAQYTKYAFDMKILDEVHHLTSNNIDFTKTTRKYIEIFNIQSKKQLSLTATLKQLESNNEDDIIISNDDVKFFGEIIDKKSLLWSINENIICDYVIQTIITDKDKFNEETQKVNITDKNDKRLYLSAFSALKSISDGYSHHLLIYSNNKKNSLKIIEYIKLFLDGNYFNIPEIYYENYHSEKKLKKQKEIIENFEKAKFGIISCIYCLGEGWDFPLLDGVVFAENMTSNIRIVQSALRASRKDIKDKNKKTKIIIPILDKDEFLGNKDNSDYKKIREIIYQLGLEDENIIYKIKVYKIDIKEEDALNKKDRKDSDIFGEYDDEITEKLKLKTITRLSLNITFEKARKIILEKNIKDKESYYKLCDIDHRLSKEPDVVFKGKFKSWTHYFGIKMIYYDLETCRKKINEYLILYPEIQKHYLDWSKIVNELCKIDELFPPCGLWIDYYDVHSINDIFTITKKKKISSII